MRDRRRTTRDSAAAAPSRRVDEKTKTEAAEVAAYIADLTRQLELMAHASRLDMLAYFLSMACFEATSLAAAGDEESPREEIAQDDGADEENLEDDDPEDADGAPSYDPGPARR